MGKFPCENCLTLPICKSLYKDCMQLNSSRIFIREIEDKCSLIKTYLSEYKNDNESVKERCELISLLYNFFYKGLTKHEFKGLTDKQTKG